MNNRTEFKNIREFLFRENRTFIIPNYQRGYKWAVKLKDKKVTAVEKLIRDLRNANKQQEYFLQGVTVSEEGNNIILIDGQQRTTTLYLLLWALKYDKFEKFNLQYDIREKSKNFINELKNDNFDYTSFDIENNIQDVFYFKKAIEQIKEEIKEIEDRAEFINFILNKVTIIYIVIDKDKATKTFTMVNGAKATMLQEELVKAEMLRKISIPDIEDKQVSSSVEENLQDLKEIITKDWETNALRSRYAREWDKWLYWWNRKDVKEFFNIESPMGLLLDYFYERKGKKKFSFDNFKGLITENDKTGKQKTKLILKELRDTQKSFEDIFNFPKIHNYLKMALICSAGKDDKFEILNYFINNKKDEETIANYSKWRLVGATHRQITKDLRDDEETKENKAQTTLSMLLDDFAYQNSYDAVLKQLLRLNVEEDNKLFEGKGRKFDFSIYGNKSLEHIHPKSKVYHKKNIGENDNEIINYFDGNDNDIGHEVPEDKEWLKRADFEGNGTEHCVGNLVLLDKNENSKFKDKPFNEKKKIYFDVNEGFKSRNLLHSIFVFAKSQWGIKDIQENKNEFIKRFKKDYNINDEK